MFSFFSLDIVALLILAVFGVIGWRRGFIGSVVKLISFIAVFAVTALWWKEGIAWLTGWVGQGWWVPILWVVLSTTLVAIGGRIVGFIAQKMVGVISFVPLVGLVNAFLGAVIGLLQGSVTVLFLLALLLTISRVKVSLMPLIQGWFDHAPVVGGVARFLVSFI